MYPQPPPQTEIPYVDLYLNDPEYKRVEVEMIYDGVKKMVE